MDILSDQRHPKRRKEIKQDRGQWCHLPGELLALIGERIESFPPHPNNLLAAVCKQWRSSLMLLPKKSPPLSSFNLPDPNYNNSSYEPLYYSIIECPIYQLKEAHDDEIGNENPSNSWLVKLEEDRYPKMHLLNPLSKSLFQQVPKEFNLLKFRVSEICKSYHLLFHNSIVDDVQKVAFVSTGNYVAVMAILNDMLWYWRSGDQGWTEVYADEHHFSYFSCDDVVFHKGHFYAIGRFFGRLLAFDSTLKAVADIRYELLKEFQPLQGQKYFVESSGDLFLVDCWKRGYFLDTRDTLFRVYKLNDEDNEWVLVKSLGDRALFLAESCSFFVPVGDLSGFKANCIYFSKIKSKKNPRKRDKYQLKEACLSDLGDGTFWRQYPASFEGYPKVFRQPYLSN